MRIAVLGAGAMGALFGGYLSTKHEVVLIDVNQQLIDKIQQDGLTIAEPDGSSSVYRPQAAADTAGLAPVDLMIVFVKAMFSNAALNNNRHLIGEHTVLMTLQNGSGHEDVLLRFVDRARVVIGTTQHNCMVVGPGSVRHGGSGDTYIGPLTGDEKQLQGIADSFSQCGLKTECRSDVQKLIWNKMFTNVSASVLTGLLQVPLGFISENPHAWAVCCSLVRETVAVAAKLGMDFDADEKIEEIQNVCQNSPEGITSIFVDIRDGRKSEVETITGSVARASERLGIAAPGHTMMLHLIHAMEAKNERQS